MKMEGHVRPLLGDQGRLVRISATTATGEDKYLRYHQDGSGILGFVAFWNNAQRRREWRAHSGAHVGVAGLCDERAPFVEPPGFTSEEAPCSHR